MSGERQGYYGDFGSLATLAQTLRHGFFRMRPRIRRSGTAGTGASWTPAVPATRLLAYTCTHDQVGNRALGDRPSQNLDAGQLAVKAAPAIRISLHRNAFHG